MGTTSEQASATEGVIRRDWPLTIPPCSLTTLRMILGPGDFDPGSHVLQTRHCGFSLPDIPRVWQEVLDTRFRKKGCVPRTIDPQPCVRR